MLYESRTRVLYERKTCVLYERKTRVLYERKTIFYVRRRHVYYMRGKPVCYMRGNLSLICEVNLCLIFFIVFRPYKDTCFLWTAKIKQGQMQIGSGKTLCWNTNGYSMSKCTGVCERRDEACLPTKTKGVTVNMECEDGELCTYYYYYYYLFYLHRADRQTDRKTLGQSDRQNTFISPQLHGWDTLPKIKYNCCGEGQRRPAWF